VLVPLFGTGLIYTAHFDLWKTEWLLIAIPIYVAIFSFSLFVQTPNGNKLIKLLQGMPGPGVEDGAPRAVRRRSWRRGGRSCSSAGSRWGSDS
jgi:hypothetical protein